LQLYNAEGIQTPINIHIAKLKEVNKSFLLLAVIVTILVLIYVAINKNDAVLAKRHTSSVTKKIFIPFDSILLYIFSFEIPNALNHYLANIKSLYQTPP
jgi:hypothetical protein